MNKVLIRLFDIIFSLSGLIILTPLFLIISIWIKLDSPGGVLFLQRRVGKDDRDFEIWKFRTMYKGSDKKDLLTIGAIDSRITHSGAFLRKYKLDELTQLINVLKGEMSLVGPRPEVRKYVSLYNNEQRKILRVKPGITDFASIEYANENEMLAQSKNPEQFYINEIMPAKIRLNLEYIANPSLGSYFTIIFKTFLKLSR